MRISQAAQAKYRRNLKTHQSNAEKYVRNRLRREAQNLAVSDAREKAIEILKDSLSIYGDRAQALSAQLFDEVCEAEGIDAASEMFDGVIDESFLEDKIRYYAKYLAGDEPDAQSFGDMCSQLASYYVLRSAYENTVRNCDKSNVSYARIPGGGETCNFCMMLAGSGATYKSEQTAIGSHGVHAHCDCVVMPAKKGSTVIDGYDAYVCKMLYQKFEEIDGYDMPAAQKDAIKTAWSSAYTKADHPGLVANQKEVADTYERGIESAMKAFKKNKTVENYNATVNRFLGELGNAYGCKMSGMTEIAKSGNAIGASPNGSEIWTTLNKHGEDSRFICAISSVRRPDVLIDGRPFEIKTPTSVEKFPKRMKSASGQFVEYPGSPKSILVDVSLSPQHESEYMRIGEGFVKSGTVDAFEVIHRKH
ncbi:hypothetical protein [uncultured Olegusella sp.]|uniref:VG15 protein n=1 Tax=uncultured Olegusella sp. TaxID=1979846 RepID=UPI00261565FF|nr:hypothetical protein [uncultured Olegusella sp.]